MQVMHACGRADLLMMLLACMQQALMAIAVTRIMIVQHKVNLCLCFISWQATCEELPGRLLVDGKWTERANAKPGCFYRLHLPVRTITLKPY